MASGPLITTINDLVAVVVYYGLAMIVLIDMFHLADLFEQQERLRHRRSLFASYRFSIQYRWVSVPSEESNISSSSTPPLD